MSGWDGCDRADKVAREVVECHGIWNARGISGRSALSNQILEGTQMSHMVIYRGPDGSPGYHQTDEVHDAVAFVEQLRNDQGVEEARIFRMEQVNFEYRPYFRVELTSSEPSLNAGASTPAVGAAPAAPADPPPVVNTPGPAAAPETAAPQVKVETPSESSDSSASDSNGDVGARRGLFGR